jgi:hypothetical protein
VWVLSWKATFRVHQKASQLAQRAFIAVLIHGLGPVGLDGVMAVALTENVGSWRVMAKTGTRS